MARKAIRNPTTPMRATAAPSFTAMGRSVNQAVRPADRREEVAVGDDMAVLLVLVRSGRHPRPHCRSPGATTRVTRGAGVMFGHRGRIRTGTPDVSGNCTGKRGDRGPGSRSEERRV